MFFPHQFLIKSQTEKEVEDLNKFWKKYGHHVVYFAAGVLIVLFGYGVGNLVFKDAKAPEEQVQNIIVEKPEDKDPVENPAENPAEEQLEESEPDEEESRDIREVKEREIVNYEIIEKEDPSLEKGKTKVVQEGGLGEIEYTYEVIYEDGKEIAKNLLSEEYTKKPEDRIVHVGTKPVIRTVEEKVEEEIPFETIYEEDPTVYAGNLTVKTEGVKGIRTIRYEVTYEDGKEISREKIDETITRESVDKVIVTGTKPISEEPENPDTETPVG